MNGLSRLASSELPVLGSRAPAQALVALVRRAGGGVVNRRFQARVSLESEKASRPSVEGIA